MKAVIYTRVSQDTSGHARSVGEQEQECRDVCTRNEWPVDAVVSDNDLGASRWSKKSRPGYQRLTHILRTGHVLVAWESSRVTRMPGETEDLMDLCVERGVLLCYSGTVYDPSKPMDRMILRVGGATSALASDETRERVLRNVRSRMAKGKPHGRLPYGYRRTVVDMQTGETEWQPDEQEQAPVVREIVARILKGESLYRITQSLNERGIKPPSIGPTIAEQWTAKSLRPMLLSPTYAGLRTYRGEVTGVGTWAPIISEDEHRRLTAVLTDPSRRPHSRGSDPIHLLTGIALCDVCDQGVRWAGPSSSNRNGGYKCPDSHVRRRADLVDEMVKDAMLELLALPQVQAGLSVDDRVEDAESGAALAEARDLRQRLDAFYDEAADGKLTAAALGRVEARLLPQIEEAERRARQSVSDPAFLHLVESFSDVDDTSAAWESLPLEVRRAAIRAALEIRLLVQPPMGRRFDPDYVSIRLRD